MHLEAPIYTSKSKLKRRLDWLFKDLNGRAGKYIIAEVPNLPQIVFMVSIILAVIVYPGLWQKTLVFTAYAALSYWSYLEITSGHSRFRKLLGVLGLISVFMALTLPLGF